jgi:thioredoxin reductase
MHRRVIIIGAGPGGLQLAYFLKNLGIDHLVLERERHVAGFFRKFPRHRRLISINKPNTGYDDPQTNLRWDWHSLLEEDLTRRFPLRCSDYFPLADDYVNYLEDFAARNAIEVVKDANVVSVTRPDGRFRISCADASEYTADDLVVATGLSAPRRLELPGAEHAEPYSEVSVDPGDFRGQRVLILGKGNAAFETANNLVETAKAVHLISPSPLRLASRTRYVGHVRGMNAAFQDTHSLRSQNSVVDATVQRIEPVADGLQVDFAYTDAPTRSGRLTVDRVISCLGFTFDPSIFGADCRPVPAHGDRYPAMTSGWQAANIPKLYFAGNLMHARDFQRASSGFVHGFRYNIALLAKLLGKKSHGAELEVYDMGLSPETLAELILHRADTAAALFNQPGFFSDAIVIAPDLRQAKVYQDVPIEYFRDVHAGSATYYTLTLELGANADDAAVVRRPIGPSTIHPVVRRFVDGRCVSEYHLPEDMETRWHKAEYVGPLIAWLAGDMAGAALGRRYGRPHEWTTGR